MLLHPSPQAAIATTIRNYAIVTYPFVRRHLAHQRIAENGYIAASQGRQTGIGILALQPRIIGLIASHTRASAMCQPCPRPRTRPMGQDARRDADDFASLGLRGSAWTFLGFKQRRICHAFVARHGLGGVSLCAVRGSRVRLRSHQGQIKNGGIKRAWLPRSCDVVSAV